jgi:hypothetical protein
MTLLGHVLFACCHQVPWFKLSGAAILLADCWQPSGPSILLCIVLECSVSVFVVLKFSAKRWGTDEKCDPTKR